MSRLKSLIGRPRKANKAVIIGISNFAANVAHAKCQELLSSWHFLFNLPCQINRVALLIFSIMTTAAFSQMQTRSQFVPLSQVGNISFSN